MTIVVFIHLPNHVFYKVLVDCILLPSQGSCDLSLAQFSVSISIHEVKYTVQTIQYVSVRIIFLLYV